MIFDEEVMWFWKEEDAGSSTGSNFPNTGRTALSRVVSQRSLEQSHLKASQESVCNVNGLLAYSKACCCATEGESSPKGLRDAT